LGGTTFGGICGLVFSDDWENSRQIGDLSSHQERVLKGELVPDSVVANFATTAADGKAYRVDYYNFDVIISVGYRVKSHRGTQFRI